MSDKTLVAASLAAWAASLIGASLVGITHSWAVGLVFASLSTQLLLVAALAKRVLTRMRKLRSEVRAEARGTRSQLKHYLRNSTVTHGLIADATAERIIPRLPEKTGHFTPSAPAAQVAAPGNGRHEPADFVASLQTAFADDPEITVTAASQNPHSLGQRR